MPARASLHRPDFEVRKELEGWTLFWALLERRPGADAALDALREEVAREVRLRWTRELLASVPAVAALRRLFKAAGCDPSRYRPSSEALLRRLLKGDPMPAINPLVDVNNCLSALLAAPCCVMAEGSCSPPYLLRAGREGESYTSLRGPFRLEGRPLLCDAAGPCDAPITGSERVKVTAVTDRAWLVSYLPADVVAAESALDELERLLEAAPVAYLLVAAAS